MDRRGRRALLLAAAALPLLCAAGLLSGSSALAPDAVLRALLSGDRAAGAYRIFVYVRLPRVLAAVLAGASLSAAGLTLQSVLRNPLASPGVIGVNAGAGLFALIAMVFLPGSAVAASAMAFAGALVAALCVVLLSALTGASRYAIVLSGVAVSSLLGAVMDAIVTLVPDAAAGRAAFSIGGFADATLPRLAAALPFLAAGLLLCALLGRERSILALGDEVARGVGLRVKAYRVQLLTAAALLAGGAVSFAGLLGFVGLIVPHAARMLSGSGERNLALCVFLGADLCLMCDMLSRAAFAPYEMPVGIVLSVLGAPFFLYLLWANRKGNRNDAN